MSNTNHTGSSEQSIVNLEWVWCLTSLRNLLRPYSGKLKTVQKMLEISSERQVPSTTPLNCLFASHVLPSEKDSSPEPYSCVETLLCLFNHPFPSKLSCPQRPKISTECWCLISEFTIRNKRRSVQDFPFMPHLASVCLNCICSIRHRESIQLATSTVLGPGGPP